MPQPSTVHVHQTTLVPSKIELLAAWLPTQQWWRGGTPQRVGSFRFADPAGEVGIETFLVSDAEGTWFQIPLTYRSELLDSAAQIGVTEHGVLGTRYIADALGDPVAMGAYVRTILTGERNADVVGGAPPDMSVSGTGTRPEAQVRLLRSGIEGEGTVHVTVDVDGVQERYRLVIPRVLEEACTYPETPVAHLSGAVVRMPERRVELAALIQA